MLYKYNILNYNPNDILLICVIERCRIVYNGIFPESIHCRIDFSFLVNYTNKHFIYLQKTNQLKVIMLHTKCNQINR